MKKYFFLFVLLSTFLSIASAQQAPPFSEHDIALYAMKTEQGKIDKSMMKAIHDVSGPLEDGCKPAMFIVEFILGDAGRQIDSIHIISSDSSYIIMIDQHKLKSMPVEWPLLVNKTKLSKGTRIIQPVMIMGYEENCGRIAFNQKDVLNTFSYLQSYSQELNDTAFLLKPMEIRFTVTRCGPSRESLTPIAQTSTPVTEGR